ncbi:zinc finger and SCAN domain-containing protein 29-like [Engraulis encrasicolus]|uniref:zinc finger and SCAN domain-containing protein 29-like n=1 Tax=Engraulis encrasicolus TaxID=184585 RepID=UPI002FD2F0A9
MSRGQTWADEETRALVDIWSDTQISDMLEHTHKNADVFAIFSEKLRKEGFSRSPEQCRLKLKKLRQTYLKIRDTLAKSGSSSDAKLKFKYFDDIDAILGTTPLASPVDLVEGTLPAPARSENGNRQRSPPSSPASVVPVPAEEVEDYLNDMPSSRKISIPGAKARQHLGRKRKAAAQSEDAQDFLKRQQQQLQQLMDAEKERQEKEDTYLENFLRAQREAEERRYEMMRAQMSENNNMFRLLFSAMSNNQQQHPHLPPQHPQGPPQHPPVNYWMPNHPGPALANTGPTWPTTGANEISEILHQVNSSHLYE